LSFAYIGAVDVEAVEAAAASARSDGEGTGGIVGGSSDDDRTTSHSSPSPDRLYSAVTSGSISEGDEDDYSSPSIHDALVQDERRTGISPSSSSSFFGGGGGSGRRESDAFHPMSYPSAESEREQRQQQQQQQQQSQHQSFFSVPTSAASAAPASSDRIKDRDDDDDDDEEARESRSVASLVSVEMLDLANDEEVVPSPWPSAGPPAPVSADLAGIMLDQTVDGLSEFSEGLDRDNDEIRDGGGGGSSSNRRRQRMHHPIRSSVGSSTASSNFNGNAGDLASPSSPSRSSFKDDHDDHDDHDEEDIIGNAEGGKKKSYAATDGGETSSLPSYSFAPYVQERSDRIMRSSYRPSSVTRRFRGASLLGWRRRGGRGAAAADAADDDNDGGGGGNNNEGAASSRLGFASIDEENFYPRKAATEITEGDCEDSEDDDDGMMPQQRAPSSMISSAGSLLRDTYSFIYVYPACRSSPFFYAILLFAFQSSVYALLLGSLVDVDAPRNVLGAAIGVSARMRIAQGCAILVAVFNGVDLMVAMNNLLRTPAAIIVIDGNGSVNEEEARGLLNGPSGVGDDDGILNSPGGRRALLSTTGMASSLDVPRMSFAVPGVGDEDDVAGETELSRRGVEFSGTATNHAGVGHDGRRYRQRRRRRTSSFPAGARFRFANVLRLIEGCLAVATSFILIVQSRDVIELFMNFAALEFVVNLDNLAFALAEHGLISDTLQDAARFVDGLGFAYHDGDNDGGGDRAADRRAKKRSGRGSPCTDSAGRLARLKGSFVSRLLGSPARCARAHPDGIRRTTLLVMTLTLFGCWGWILLGLEDGIEGVGADSPRRSVRVEFYHAHVPANTAQEAEGGIKPFLVSRSGTYIAAFVEYEEEENDALPSFWNRVVDASTGKSAGKKNLFLAYRKADPKVEPSAPRTQAEAAMPSVARLPSNYDDVLFYDMNTRRWVFATCDPGTDLRGDARACAGPRVRSMETDSTDFTALSSSSFVVIDENGDELSSAPLPATVTSTECRSMGGDSSDELDHGMTCGISGGTCSEPRAEWGYARTCDCPPGQYGARCQDHYGTSCPILEVVLLEGVDEPAGSMHFQRWEQREFTLKEDQRGVGNTPVWERRYGSKGFTDRLDWRGGEYWTVTRHQDFLDKSHSLAVAKGDGSAMVDVGEGMLPGRAGGNVVNNAAFNVQPPPAGLVFHAPKAAAWGTQPDFYRPYASYQFRCKAASLGTIP